MNRKEQIEKAAFEAFPEDMEHDRIKFIEGAEWADKNPPMPNADAEKDYRDMRKFQEKFIAADQELSRLKQDVSEAAKILEEYYCYDGTRSAVDAKKWLSRHGGEDDK